MLSFPKLKSGPTRVLHVLGGQGKGSVVAMAVLDSFLLFFLVGATVLDPRDLAFINEAT